MPYCQQSQLLHFASSAPFYGTSVCAGWNDEAALDIPDRSSTTSSADQVQHPQGIVLTLIKVRRIFASRSGLALKRKTAPEWEPNTSDECFFLAGEASARRTYVFSRHFAIPPLNRIPGRHRGSKPRREPARYRTRGRAEPSARPSKRARSKA